jgi:hypothetical protein
VEVNSGSLTLVAGEPQFAPTQGVFTACILEINKFPMVGANCGSPARLTGLRVEVNSGSLTLVAGEPQFAPTQGAFTDCILEINKSPMVGADCGSPARLTGLRVEVNSGSLALMADEPQFAPTQGGFTDCILEINKSPMVGADCGSPARLTGLRVEVNSGSFAWWRANRSSPLRKVGLQIVFLK